MFDTKYHQFFDRVAVIKRVKDGTKSVLAKWGSYVRRRAQTSIRPRKKPAEPGNPPSSHIDLLRKLIFFGYDANTQSVVVGPTIFQRRRAMEPAALEFGGRTQIYDRRKKKVVPAVYRAFPFMRPAEEAERERGLGLFANCVK